MARLSQKQSDELKSIGLDDYQISACENILTQIPQKMDLKAVERLTKLLHQAQSAFDDIRKDDPRFYEEIEQQLNKKLDWSYSILGIAAETLEGVRLQQKGVFVAEVDTSTNEQVTRANTPESRDYHRYKAFTDLWLSWGKEVKTSKESEFLSFLTICLKGNFSLHGVASVRNHYLRYFLGQKVVDQAPDDSKDESDVYGVEVTMKNGKTIKATLKAPKLNGLSESISQLMSERS